MLQMSRGQYCARVDSLSQQVLSHLYAEYKVSRGLASSFKVGGTEGYIDLFWHIFYLTFLVLPFSGLVPPGCHAPGVHHNNFPASIGPWGPYVFYLGQLGLPISGLLSFLSRATNGSPDGPAQENLFFINTLLIFQNMLTSDFPPEITIYCTFL